MAQQSNRLHRLQKRLQNIFKGKGWSKDLNVVFLDEKSVAAFERVLLEIELLQRQVKDLERTIEEIR